MHGILRVRCHKLEHSTDLHGFPTLGHFPVWNGSSLKTGLQLLCSVDIKVKMGLTTAFTLLLQREESLSFSTTVSGEL